MPLFRSDLPGRADSYVDSSQLAYAAVIILVDLILHASCMPVRRYTSVEMINVMALIIPDDLKLKPARASASAVAAAAAGPGPRVTPVDA